jgi:hypothetical protein
VLLPTGSRERERDLRILIVFKRFLPPFQLDTIFSPWIWSKDITSAKESLPRLSRFSSRAIVAGPRDFAAAPLFPRAKITENPRFSHGGCATVLRKTCSTSDAQRASLASASPLTRRVRLRLHRRKIHYIPTSQRLLRKRKSVVGEFAQWLLLLPARLSRLAMIKQNAFRRIRSPVT